MTREECENIAATDSYLLDSYWFLREAEERENEPSWFSAENDSEYQDDHL